MFFALITLTKGKVGRQSIGYCRPIFVLELFIDLRRIHHFKRLSFSVPYEFNRQCGSDKRNT